MATSEYCSCPPRLPTPTASHVAIASGVNHRVTSPRWTSARSYAGQFPTRYFVLYLGCTLDFTSRSCPFGRHDGQGRDEHLLPRTNAVHRVYCALRLNLPRRTTRRVPRRVRQPLTAPPVLNRTWALDFMSETLYDGRRVRLLTVIDEGNREGLEIAMGLSVPSQRVVRVLNELVAVHGCPAALRTDNGPEFLAQPFIDWCTDHRVAIHYIQPGKPDQNAYIERFNRSYRTEVLNAHLFESIAELQALTMTWLRIYNEERPHDSLGRVPPLTFLPRPKTARESTYKVST